MFVELARGAELVLQPQTATRPGTQPSVGT
jgi:hypothetical protein